MVRAVTSYGGQLPPSKDRRRRKCSRKRRKGDKNSTGFDTIHIQKTADVHSDQEQRNGVTLPEMRKKCGLADSFHITTAKLCIVKESMQILLKTKKTKRR
ncbi:hypothetical protein RB195_011089 [Necator americanus]|uniref:Uncharacterized protein n=1 Tax=Necator americanus TaxID=51031 RepID=A0ABR1D0T7_NECAM